MHISFDFPDDFDLFIGGDFCPLDLKGSSNLAVGSELLRVMDRAKLRCLNLECPLTNSDLSIQKTGPALKAHPQTVDSLKQMRIGLCNLANNHIMDYGKEGAADTMQLLESAGISHTGITEDGMNHPYIADLGHCRVAFVSFTENEFSTICDDGMSANPMNYLVQLRQIRDAGELADFVLVQYHGGAEMYPYPSPGQAQFSHFLAEAGADAVVCHHSHRFSGFELFNGIPIFYGIGNFYFPEEGNPQPWYTGLALCLSLGAELRASIVAVRFDVQSNTINIDRDEPTSIEAEIMRLNSVIRSDIELKKAWIEFCNKNCLNTIGAIFPYPRLTRFLVKKGLLKVDVSKRISLRFLNMLRCETHYEKLVTTVKEHFFPVDQTNSF